MTFWIIAILWSHSDRAYDPEDETIPVIFQHHQAKLLIYVPPGRQRVVAMDLKSMSIIASYSVMKNVEFPKTSAGEPAKIMRFYIIDARTLKGIPFETGKQLKVENSIGIIFNTRETGALDLRSGFYQFLHNKGTY